jgi:glutathione S-transferase
MLQVWGRKSSSNVQALMWCIGELGLAYQRHDVGFRFGGLDTPAFLAMNPNGTIPVLQDGDGPFIWETGAILRYLCARYATAPFWPDDLVQRATVDMWAEWAKLNAARAFTAPIFWRVVRTAARDQDPAAIAAAIADFGRILDIAERQLRMRMFLAGDALTLADIQLGHLLYRYFAMPIARPDHPAVQRYYDQLSTRPAFREHVMVPYDDLRVL